MKNHCPLERIDARQVQHIVFLNHQLQVSDELLSCFFVEIKFQTKKGRINSGPFF